MKRSAILGSAAVLAVLSAPAQAQFQSALQEAEATARETASAQQQIDQLDDQTASLLNDYRANLKQLEAARRYNASLNRNIEAQERQMKRVMLKMLQRQLALVFRLLRFLADEEYLALLA